MCCIHMGSLVENIIFMFVKLRINLLYYTLNSIRVKNIFHHYKIKGECENESVWEREREQESKRERERDREKNIDIDIDININIYKDKERET